MRRISVQRARPPLEIATTTMAATVTRRAPRLLFQRDRTRASQPELQSRIRMQGAVGSKGWTLIAFCNRSPGLLRHLMTIAGACAYPVSSATISVQVVRAIAYQTTSDFLQE